MQREKTQTDVQNDGKQQSVSSRKETSATEEEEEEEEEERSFSVFPGTCSFDKNRIPHVFLFFFFPTDV